MTSVGQRPSPIDGLTSSVRAEVESDSDWCTGKSANLRDHAYLRRSRRRLRPSAKPKPKDEDIERAAKWIFRKLNTYGVTSIQTGDAKATHLAALRKIEGEPAVEILIYNGAFGLGLEDRTGSIEVGKDADLVVLDQDLMKAPVSDIHKTKVLRTVLRGKTVFVRTE